MKKIKISIAGGKAAKNNYTSFFSYNKLGEMYSVVIKDCALKTKPQEYVTIETEEYGMKDNTLFVYKYRQITKEANAGLDAHFSNNKEKLDQFIENL